MNDTERLRRAIETDEYVGNMAPLLKAEVVRLRSERERCVKVESIKVYGFDWLGYGWTRFHTIGGVFTFRMLFLTRWFAIGFHWHRKKRP